MVDITKTRPFVLWFSMAASDQKPSEFNRILPIDFIADQIRRRVTTQLAKVEIVRSILEVV